jgi:glucokinase
VLAIGVDLGGTKVAAGVVDDQGRIIDRFRRPSSADDAVGLVADVVAVIDQCRAAHDVGAVGVAVAGFIDATGDTVLFSPNLAWRDEPLRAEVERACGLATVVENDANAAAWGEYRYGAGADAGDDVVCVTIGTGVGGGAILGGRLLRGHFGIAAEIGHVSVVHEGQLCGCGQRGCLEQYASGSALVVEARRRAGADPQAAATLLALGDGTPDGVQGAHVTGAARAGDPVATAAFEVIGGWLGVGLADIAAVLDPAVFVVGGGVSEAGELLLAPARRAFEASLTGTGHRPVAQLRLASLGNAAGIVGAADLARARLGAGAPGGHR